MCDTGNMHRMVPQLGHIAHEIYTGWSGPGWAVLYVWGCPVFNGCGMGLGPAASGPENPLDLRTPLDPRAPLDPRTSWTRKSSIRHSQAVLYMEYTPGPPSIIHEVHVRVDPAELYYIQNIPWGRTVCNGYGMGLGRAVLYMFFKNSPGPKNPPGPRNPPSSKQCPSQKALY